MILHDIQEALLNLWSAKLRSVLALLGILVGTASVVAIVLGGELAANEALQQFKTLGTDLLAVSITEAQSDDHYSNREEHLTVTQAKHILSASPAIQDVAPYTQIFNALTISGNSLTGSVLGVTDAFGRIAHLEVEEGRFISFLEGNALFCVVGYYLGAQIQAMTSKNPMGQQIQLGQTFFTIIGVLKPWPENSFVYANINNAMMIPLLTSLSLNKYTSINNIIFKLSSTAAIDGVENQIQNYILSVMPHKNLFFRSAKELIAKMSKQSEIFTLFLGLIGSIALLVGGIGVMNIMLVSVVERRPEIGIRLAVGARRKDIRLLFLIEAVMLSFLGGTMGVLLGILIAFIMAAWWHWQFTLFLLPPAVGFTVSVATGIFFGFYPAHKASQLDPIQALRTAI